MAKRDYYEVLGVDRNADAKAVKKAYRNLAMKYHPDRNPGDASAAETMKDVNEAYAVLNDPKKRELYNSYGHAGLDGFSQEDIFRGVDFSNLFSEFGLGDLFGFGGDSFGGMFGGRTRTRQRTRKGADIRYDLELTLDDVASGFKKTITLDRASTCAGCRGSGAEAGGEGECESCRGSGRTVREERSGFGVVRQILTCGTCRGNGRVITEPCATCEGRGKTVETVDLEVDVPAGVEDGHALRVTGEGEAGPDLPGDLFVVLNVAPDPRFERRGQDLYVRQEVDIATAALGGDVDVPTLDGPLTVTLPQSTQHGTTFRLSGHGLPHLRGSGTGDEYVVIRVGVPTDLSDEERRLLEDYRQLRRRSTEDVDEQS